MKLILAILLTTYQLSNFSLAYEYESIAIDLEQGFSPIEAAKHAFDADQLSQDIVNQFIDENIDVVKAVQTVAKTWNSCDDTYISVQTGVKNSPDRAAEIVSSIASMKNCNCSSKSFWAKSRMEHRLRPRINRALVEISTTCGCAAAGIEAAIEIVPSHAEEMIEAVMVAKNRAERTVDSIGKIGQLPEQNYWGHDLVKTKGTNLFRMAEVCKGDHNELDDFKPEDSWSNINDLSLNSPIQTYNKNLGTHKLLCNDEEDEDELEEKDKNNNKLIISQYVQDEGENQALELFNSSNEAIDLLRDNYQVEVYFHGYDFPGEIIQLNGLIEPQSTFVIADANSDPYIGNRANQKVNGLTFKGADAITLKSDFKLGQCQCAASTIAAALKGSGSNENEEEIPEQKQELIDLLEQHYQNVTPQTTVVDSVGRLLVNDKDNSKGESKPITEDLSLLRFTNICKGDRIELNEFYIENEWSVTSSDDISSAGVFNQQECKVTRKDLLVSEFLEGKDDNAMIELFNGTDRPINFDNEDYFLEIHNDDNTDPDQRIKLNGNIDKNGVFVIVHSDSDKPLKDKAQMITGQLDLKDARAVVLKKVVLPAFQSCYADIASWIEITELEEPIEYTLEPTLDPGNGPISGDDPTDGDDGGQLASPN